MTDDALQKNASEANETARDLQDTHRNSSFKETVQVIDDLGFKQVFARSFTGYETGEVQRIYWRNDGILLVMETWRGEDKGTVNTLTIYYNIQFANPEDGVGVTGSGEFLREEYDAGKYIWLGADKVQEDLRYTISELEKVGTFLPVWVADPYLFLEHYAEEDTAPVRDILNAFPIEVQEAIAVVDPEHWSYTAGEPR